MLDVYPIHHIMSSGISGGASPLAADYAARHNHPMSFSDRLREARKRAGLTQSQLAVASNVRQSTISRYESEGEREEHSSSHLIAIAEVLGVTVEWLKTGAESRSQAQELGSRETARLAFRAYCRDEEFSVEHAELAIAETDRTKFSDGGPDTFEGWFAQYKQCLHKQRAKRKGKLTRGTRELTEADD